MKKLGYITVNGRVFEPCYVVNDWMSLRWFIGHNHITTSYGTHSIRDQTDRKLEASFVADALFPDGQVAEVRVEKQPSVGRYSDHGHESVVHTHKFVAKVMVNGMEVELPADKLHFDPETIEEWQDGEEE